MIEVKKTVYPGEIAYEATCTCGEQIYGSIIRGDYTMPSTPTFMPGDMVCDKCGRAFNCHGQELNVHAVHHPEEYGEVW